MPFSIMRNHRCSLVEQVTHGLREAIHSGFYKPGDILPSTQLLAERLGVSRIVTRAALKALTAEGLVNPRPGTGALVLAHGKRLWKGNVLFISRSNGIVYYENVFRTVLRKQLLVDGWHLMEATVVSDNDLDELDLQLTTHVDFAVVLFDNPAAERVLSKAGVPFVVLGDKTTYRRPGAVGYVRYDRSAGAGKMAEACRTLGIRRVLQVNLQDFDDVGAAFSAVGIESCTWLIAEGWSADQNAASYFAVRDAFLARLDREPFKKTDLLYFSDDCAFVGGFAAFACRNIRLPDDLRVASFAVKGNGPISYGELPRLELDPVADATEIAEAVKAYLANARWTGPKTIQTHFVGGEGFLSGKKNFPGQKKSNNSPNKRGC
ncbi:MAG: GntR family transcriptional regulator [Kiritimatiellae bacterium]|nr:GntR family transcriptional regulator [Kiritimatiellia bacterium]